MVKKSLNKIFLSASIPLAERHPEYYKTADFIAIRDSIKALASTIIPRSHLIWGGHPSITPLIHHVIEKMGVETKNHVTLYQSLAFTKHFPKSNSRFEKIIYTPEMESRDSSIRLMREEMIGKNDYVAGIFIGGMEGILAEYEIFRKYQPNALVIPIASTGAAAKVLFNIMDEMNLELNERLLNDYAYISLFTDLLKDYI